MGYNDMRENLDLIQIKSLLKLNPLISKTDLSMGYMLKDRFARTQRLPPDLRHRLQLADLRVFAGSMEIRSEYAICAGLRLGFSP
jgi:hypothetical protein